MNDPDSDVCARESTMLAETRRDRPRTHSDLLSLPTLHESCEEMSMTDVDIEGPMSELRSTSTEKCR